MFRICPCHISSNDFFACWRSLNVFRILFLVRVGCIAQQLPDYCTKMMRDATPYQIFDTRIFALLCCFPITHDTTPCWPNIFFASWRCTCGNKNTLFINLFSSRPEMRCYQDKTRALMFIATNDRNVCHFPNIFIHIWRRYTNIYLHINVFWLTIAIDQPLPKILTFIFFSVHCETLH